MKKICLTFLTLLCLHINANARPFADTNVQFRSKINLNRGVLANISGYADEMGNEYAIVGNYEGVSVVNVTNPDSIWVICHLNASKSSWREIKVWKNYAYAVTEGGGGLMIIDLNPLPTSQPTDLPVTFWAGTTPTNGFNSAHTNFIDENGVLYVFSSNVANVMMYDVNTNPLQPIYLGKYLSQMPTWSGLHDGYARNNKLYLASNNSIVIVNVANKQNPVLIEKFDIPGAVYLHNIDLTNDGTRLLTTDEMGLSYMYMCDITNLTDVKIKDRVYYPQYTVHNTHIIQGNWAITSWYSRGIVIHDVSNPNVMAEVGSFDSNGSNFNTNSNNYNGAWGVYPYLPSGNLLVSDIENGLIVLTPNYVKAGYIYGKIIDSITQNPLGDVNITIEQTQSHALTNKSTGIYNIGTVAGKKRITFRKENYFPKTIEVDVIAGQTDTIPDIKLSAHQSVSFATYTRSVEGYSLQPQLVFHNKTKSFASGCSQSICITPSFYKNDTYTVQASLWGYTPICYVQDFSKLQYLQLTMLPGYADNFTFDNKWTFTHTKNSIYSWDIYKHKETVFYPNSNIQAFPDHDATQCDSTNVSGLRNAYWLGGKNGMLPGIATLQTPQMNNKLYTQAQMNYSFWFAPNSPKYTTPAQVFLVIEDQPPVLIDEIMPTPANTYHWTRRSVNLADFLPDKAVNFFIKLEITCSDARYTTTAGFDDFEIIDISPLRIPINAIDIHPNPATNSRINLNYTLRSAAPATLYITDVLGKIVHTELLTNSTGIMTITPKLAVGMYYVGVLQANERYKTEKLLLTH